MMSNAHSVNKHAELSFNKHQALSWVHECTIPYLCLSSNLQSNTNPIAKRDVAHAHIQVHLPHRQATPYPFPFFLATCLATKY